MERFESQSTKLPSSDNEFTVSGRAKDKSTFLLFTTGEKINLLFTRFFHLTLDAEFSNYLNGLSGFSARVSISKEHRIALALREFTGTVNRYYGGLIFLSQPLVNDKSDNHSHHQQGNTKACPLSG
jgi:hypothetical protein